MPKERESDDASTNKTQIKKDDDLLVIERKMLINLPGHFTKFLPMKKSQVINHSLDSSEAAMDMHILYFLKRNWIPAISISYPYSSPPTGLVAIEPSLKVWICLSCCCWGFSLFFEMSVTLHIEIKQTFKIHGHISGRERLFLHGCLVPISPNRP